jgi:adenylate cyclase
VPEQEVERRLAAILSADIVGYSRLMSDDEDSTVRTLRAYRDQIDALVREHRGRLVDFSGDNFLAEFPSALAAVSCAIEIQRVLRARNASLPADRKMEFRIGAHLGDVRIEGDRVYGDGVNIAARLEGLAEPGGICISATVHEQVRNRLEASFTDLGDRTVKNIPDQVRAYQVGIEGEATPEPRRLSRRWPAIAAALIALVGIAIWAAWPRLLGLGLDLAGITGPAQQPALPDKPSLVVLPFANLSGDPDQEYFSDGITEDLTAALSQSSALFVISRNSAFTYKGRAVNIEEVGRELGVRYVLEGSVRREENRVRITAQLIDAASDFHVWSGQYDREFSDIFELQSEISREIFASVGAQVTDAEIARIQRKPTEDLTAYDAYMRAQSHFFRFTRRDTLEARRWLERAIELDPRYVEPLSMLAATYNAEYALLWTTDPANLERAEQLANRAIEIDPSFAGSYMVLGAARMLRSEVAAAIDVLHRAIALGPNEAPPRIFLGMALSLQGQPVAGLESLRQGMRLNPRVAASSAASSLLAALYSVTGRKEEGIRLLESARANNPDHIPARMLLADHYASTGRLEEARTVVAEILRINPDLTAQDAANGAFAGSRDPEARQALAENLRRAGMP